MDVKPGAKLFTNLGRKRAWLMVRKDLGRVGIPYETEEGIADFHAAGRHTHITELLRSGASLPEAKELARHSDINMTMRYTHMGMDDRAKAVANLPSPKGRPEQAIPAAKGRALQMRGIFYSAEGHSQASTGNRALSESAKTLAGARVLVADRRQLAKWRRQDANRTFLGGFRSMAQVASSCRSGARRTRWPLTFMQ